jgi:hypothetical protein
MASNLLSIDAFPSAPQLGQAYNSVQDRLEGPAKMVNFASIVEIERNEFDSSFELITDTKSLLDNFEVQGSLKINILSVPISGSIHGEYLKLLKKESNSVYFMYKTKIKTKEVQMGIDNVSWNPAPQTLDASAFLENFGDSFVSSITYGAEFYGLCEISCSSVEEKEIISGGITAKASFTAISGELEGNLKKDFKEIVGHNKVTFTIRSRGGMKLPNQPTNLEEMLLCAKQFTENIAECKSPIFFSFTPYTRVPNFTPQLNPPMDVTAVRRFLCTKFVNEILDWQTFCNICDKAKGNISCYTINGNSCTRAKP